MSAIPIIDVGPLLAGTREEARTVANSLGRACREVGFFYIVGHGVQPDLRKRVFDTAAAFFSGPASIREAASFSGPGGNRGYIRLGGEALDPDKPADVKEAFNIGLELAPDDPELLARAPFRDANLWPEMPGFRDTMLDYFNRVWRLGRDLHRGFALDLGLRARLFRGQARQADGDDAPAALSAGPSTTRRRAARRGRSHRLRQRDPARHRFRRRADGAGSLGPVARCACHRRRLCLQYRRLPDALVERRLCVDAAQGGEPARGGPLFRRLLSRPQSGRDRRLPADLHQRGAPGQIWPDQRRRFSSLPARAHLRQQQLPRQPELRDCEPNYRKACGFPASP